MHFTHISAQQKRHRAGVPLAPPTPVVVGAQTPASSSYHRFGTLSYGGKKASRSITLQSQTPKDSQSENKWDVPAQSKYTEIWQRVRSKLKTQLMLKNLRTQLNLFGPGSTTALSSTEGGLMSQFRTVSQTQDMVVAHSKRWIINPDGVFKQVWDLLSSFAILYIAVFLPYTLAFEEDKPWIYMDYGLDAFFFIELLLTCNLAYDSGDGTLVTDRREIVARYLKTWFFPDLLACIPFAEILSSEVESRTVLRMTSLYRFIRLTKVLKALRNSYNNRILVRLQDFFHLGISGYRLVVTLIGMLLVIHFVACMWVFTARMEDFSPMSWPMTSGMSVEDKLGMYIAAFYWAVTSFTTVGYGDITAETDGERLLAVIWMLTGVYFFSFLLTALTNLILNSDSK